MQTIFSNKIVIGVIVGVISLVGLWSVWKMLGTSAQKTAQPVDLKVTDSDWQRGSASPSATLVEYSDFQCPACKAYAPLVDEVIKKNADKVRLVYRNYPLPQHQHSKLAAYYAEAAGMQGAFFQMHDKLFEGQADWDKSDKPQEIFLSYAKELKLDINKLNADVKSNVVAQNVEEDITSGTAAGVDSTPSFFLNGVKITSPQSIDEFDKLIKESSTRK